MLTAAAGYFAIVFAAGFALGAVRATLIAPRAGDTLGVLIEVPLMLAVSWLACRYVMDRLAVRSDALVRLSIGSLALLLLLTAETAISLLFFQRSLSEHFQAYRTLPAQIGLAAQLIFSLFPLLCRR